MTPIVVDSSVIVKWINQVDEKHIRQADKLLTEAGEGLVLLVTTELAKYEVGNALMRKKLALAKAQESLATVYHLPITFIAETEELARETFRLAYKFHMTYYDAAFVALAKLEQATLITDNIKHQGKVKNLKVIALGDY